MNTPLFDVGSVVYFRESAAIGSLESAAISGMCYTDQGWVYTLNQSRPGLVAQSTFGDRISVVSGAKLYFSEDELVDKTEAIRLAQLNNQLLANRYTQFNQ